MALILMNADTEEIAFRLPSPPGGLAWRQVLDTANPDFVPLDAANGDNGGSIVGEAVTVAARSLVCLRALPGPETGD